jgi:hypothetical protein
MLPCKRDGQDARSTRISLANYSILVGWVSCLPKLCKLDVEQLTDRLQDPRLLEEVGDLRGFYWDLTPEL